MPFLQDKRRRKQAKGQERKRQDGEKDGDNEQPVGNRFGILKVGRDARWWR